MLNEYRRLESIDALRGFNMLFITGLSGFIVALCKLFPGGDGCFLEMQMHHAEWNGFTQYDTIFPLFLFLAGVSFPFSYARSREKGLSSTRIYLKMVERTCALILLGMVYNGLLRLDFAHLRFYSVLGHIGLAWMLAAVLFVNFKPLPRAGMSVAILVGYHLLCTIPAPDATGVVDSLSKDGCLAGWIDRILCPGHLHYGNFDPEGILSTLPATVTAMLGMFTGDFIRKDDLSGGRKTLYMLGAAVVLLGAGLVWANWFPLNKKLWTSSFTLVAGAWSLALFAIFYWLIDIKGYKSWTLPLKVVGMNSLLCYFLPSALDIDSTVDFFFGGVISLVPGQWAPVISNLAFLLICWGILFLCYKKKIFLKV